MDGPQPVNSSFNLVYTIASALVIGLCLAVLLLRRGTKAAATPVPQPVSSSVRPSIELENKPVIKILYGTQTGTAERFSKQLSTELRKRHDGASVQVVNLENYKDHKASLSKEKLVIFLVATYGDGEPTDDAADFHAWLVKELEVESAEPCLSGVRYAVFGLGNKQYEHFNAIGKRVHSGLLALGATPVVRRGDGDDDACIDDDFDKWCGELHDALDGAQILGIHHADQNGHAAAAAGPPPLASLPTYNVELASPGTAEVSPFPCSTGASATCPFWAQVTTVRELHCKESMRSCVHVELDISQAAALHYEAGDHVGIYAQNQPVVVDEVAAMLGTSPDTLFTLTAPGAAAAVAAAARGDEIGGGQEGLTEPPPGPLSLRTALAYFVDVLSAPHREALAALSACATVPAEAERLLRLSSPAGRTDYQEFIHKPRRSLLEVLRTFPSCRPSLGLFFGCIAPRLVPRFYSISSSPKAHQSSIHVTCAVVKEVTPTGRTHEGLCSTWLARHVLQASGGKVPIFVRRSHFKLPADPATAVIMVGPGTGLAPFRGFLQERAALMDTGVELGPCHLFFGCRNQRHDYIYQSELMGFFRSGALTALHVAFSRDSAGASKDYVQHHMAREGAALWQLLQPPSKGHFYVCGDAKHMAKDVHRALVGLVEQHKKCSVSQAEAFVKEMQDSGRYQRDVW